jgi:hypothetical protein
LLRIVEPDPGGRAAAWRKRVNDNAAADRCRRGRPSQHETIARPRQHRLLEHDAHGTMVTGLECATGGHDSCADVGGAEVKADPLSRTQDVGVAQERDLGAKQGCQRPAGVGGDPPAPGCVGGVGTSNGDGGPRSGRRASYVRAVDLYASHANGRPGRLHDE